MAIAETINCYLYRHHIPYELRCHPKTYTSHATAQAAHINEDHMAKAVMVKDEHGYAVVVIPGNQWLGLHALNRQLGRDFHLASEGDFTDLFNDCDPGAIPPLGQAYGLETFLDEQLTSLGNVYFEAGDHETLVCVNQGVFGTLFEGVRHGHFCHAD
ncbi:MAG: YbaK/EbsC family protein [Gammaproteobacteria bacterium]|nr:MAG: YbaK/EbsC family protein [Gammaproteobacteria bacterium]